MSIVYEEWNCKGVWMDVKHPEEMPLCIKKYNGSIIVAFEDMDGNLHESTSFAESEYMEAFSAFLNRLP